MSARSGSVLAVAALLCAFFAAPRSLAADEPRAAFDFEDGVQGFRAARTVEGVMGPDPAATVEVTHDKDAVKSGAGTLSYRYALAQKTIPVLAAPVKLPANAQSVRFWIRSANPTEFTLALAEPGQGTHNLAFYIPAFHWTEVAANLDELTADDKATNPNAPVHPDQVQQITFIDMGSLFANAPPEVAKNLTNLAGPRQVWLDDVRFSAERLPQTRGPIATSAGAAYLVDNFETPTVRWMPIRIEVVNGMPKLTPFPEIASLAVLPEAAGKGAGSSPIEPGGKGLRFTYTRGEHDAFAIMTGVHGADLAGAERLQLSVNCSRKMLLAVQIKETNDAEYRYIVQPDDATGWHDLDLKFSDFTLDDQSKDPTGKIDPTKIKEVSIADATIFLGMPVQTGDTSIDLDAIYFLLK